MEGESSEVERLLRLDSLEVLGGPNPTLDVVSELATEFIHVAAAAVVFVDDRLAWLKAGYNIDRDLRIPREASIAGHVVADRETICIDDLLEDPRFRSHPQLIRLGFRSAACAPIILKDATIPGAVLILDNRPRHFSNEEMQHLDLIAEIASGLLEERTFVPVSRLEEIDTLRIAVDAAPSGIAVAILNSDLTAPRFLYVNDAFLKLTECERAELLSGHERAFSSGRLKNVGDAIVGAMLHGRRRKIEDLRICDDGDRFWDVDVSPVDVPDGHPHFIIVLEDRSEQHHVRTQLQTIERERVRSDALVSTIFSEVSDFLTVADVTPLEDGGPRIELANPAACGFMGVEASELQGKNILDFVDVSTDDRTKRALRNRIERHLPIALELAVRRPRGGVAWIAVTATIVRDEAGQPAHWLVLARDITARKEHYRETNEFVTALESAEEAIVIYHVVDDEFEVAYSNRAAMSAERHSFEELVGSRSQSETETILGRLRKGATFSIIVSHGSPEHNEWISLELRPSVEDGRLRSVIAIEHPVEPRGDVKHDLIVVAGALGATLARYPTEQERLLSLLRVLESQWGAELTLTTGPSDAPVTLSTGQALFGVAAGTLAAQSCTAVVTWHHELGTKETTALRVFLEAFVEAQSGAPAR